MSPAIDDDDDDQRRIAGVAALEQPQRLELYRLLRRRGDWTSRDEASELSGIGRSTVAFHLDKLVEVGVLETSAERRTGRTGPGAGRPTKLYRVAAVEVAASIPPRAYDLAAALLVDAVADASRTGEPVDACLHRVAHSAGRDDTARVRPDTATDAVPVLDELLRDLGYQPAVDDAGAFTLTNCPFHRLAETQRDIVCTMNLDYLTGCLEGLGIDGARTAVLDPRPGRCCVRVAPGAGA